MEQYPPSVRSAALAMIRQGASYADVTERFGVPRGTLGWWRSQERRALGIPVPDHRPDCPRCQGRPFGHSAYSYLLGLYLGDGHIISRGKQHHLSLFCSARWPGLVQAAEEAMQAVMSRPRISRRTRNGCVEVKSFSRHWVCMFPQHGPGRKHERRIVLESWQETIVDEHPWEFVRGLIHSDGSRVTNWVVRTIGGEPKRYEYPRYFFTNTSVDIMALFTGTLDRLGVEWRSLRQHRRAVTVSIARRESVALLDARVGAKY
ncbi:helix-turn-helix domain-containing protein [Streptomyces sp. YIM 98790]|uniref:helix-turn-helix domain-containing protein n=1 Tax=Streptomyces sp. YIM 98790 TaxID=2689077 RepID=UPI00140E9306|nr:helix-turn-helix domain-containing protein [Streptomyces sp. YIM 98790]